MQDHTSYIVEQKKYVGFPKKRDVAGVGIRDSIGRILLIRTHRLPEHWQPVGGGIEEGETPIEAALREVYEEIGIQLRAEQIKLSLKAPYDFGEGTVYFFETTLHSSLPEFVFKENEIAEHRWFEIAQAQELPAFPATKTFLDSLVT